jgi:hypothetical protein
MAMLMLIEGAADGQPTPFDGQYLVEYDPERDGVAPDGRPMQAHIVCTADPARAKRFAGLAELHKTWSQVSKRVPRRQDGKPNRPLTAFSVTTVLAT